MKNYEDYEVTTTPQVDSNVYLAVKKDAASMNGISFNHMFYFQKTINRQPNCTVNGIRAIEFKPDFDDNHYYAFVEDGIVHSLNMQDFFFEKEGVGYVNRERISLDCLLTKKQKNID